LAEQNIQKWSYHGEGKKGENDREYIAEDVQDCISFVGSNKPE
jgi:hypothetical protein